MTSESRTFSQQVKEECAKSIPGARHCRIAELAVILFSFGTLVEKDGERRLVISTEQESIARKCFTLTEKTFNIEIGLQKNEHLYRMEIAGEDVLSDLLPAVKMNDFSLGELKKQEQISPILIKTECCRRAFLRSSFLCFGSISDPQKGYHLEFVCQQKAQAEQITEVLKDFGLAAKTILRKKYYVVYLKEGAAIVDLINIIGAHVALMDLENYRILHEIAGNTNRRVNCEAANILKSVNAANAQIEDIEFIEKTVGLKALPPQLYEMAMVRLENREATLKELGEFLNPQVGKSGVNHRLRKIQEFAEKLKG